MAGPRKTTKQATRTSRYRGVYWDRTRGLWSARLQEQGKGYFVGRFEVERVAAQAYDYFAWQKLGDRARLNFAAPPDHAPEPTRKRRTPGAKVSKYRGVVGTKGRFSGVLVVSGKNHNLGTWPTEREAAIAHDRAVHHFELDKPLNCPRTSRRLGGLAPANLRNEARLQERRRHGKTRFIGVYKVPGRNHYQAHVVGDGGRMGSAGGFSDPELAAEAHDRVALYLYGAGIVLNFPDRDLVPTSPEDMRAEARRLFKARTTSQYRGVMRKGDGWSAQIGHRGKSFALGSFEREEEAAAAYDRAARRYHRHNAKLNFPDE